MPWFFEYGWIIPLVFLTVFLILFFLHRKNFGAGPPCFAGSSYQRKCYWDKEFNHKKIDKIKDDITELKEMYGGTAGENFHVKLKEVEQELEQLKEKYKGE